MRSTSAAKAYATRNPNANFGRLVDYLPGLSGLTPAGGIPLINFDCDRRFHKIILQTSAVNYTGGAGLVVTNLTVPAAAAGTADLAVTAFGVPGVVSGIAGAAAGWTTGDIGLIADATGAGAQFTATAAAGALTALVYIPGSATATAINPALLVGPIQLTVNGSPIVDTTAGYELRRARFNFEIISAGQLPIFFSEPWREKTKWPEITSWDMAGQKTFAMKLTINPGYTLPNITGVYEYDYIRNTVIGEIDSPTYQGAIASGNAAPPMLHIIARHLFTPQLNGGQTILPGGTPPITWPILRLHFDTAPIVLTQAIIKADNQIYEQGFIGASALGTQLDQLRELLVGEAFDITQFDYSYVADKTQRIQDALKIGSEMKIALSSAAAGGITILQERVQSRYE